MKDWDIQINYGIKTGFNEAFIISGEKRKELIEQDPKSEEIIRPLLRGRDIKRYSSEFVDLWLLFIPWHFPLQKDQQITGASEKAENAFKYQYPAVYNHLLQYKEELSNRNKTETGIRYEWYALQRWGANYWEDFSKQKIVFQEMVLEPSFMLDEEGAFFCLDTGRIIIGNDIKYLIAILNSKLFFFAVKNFYGGGGLGEAGVRMKHTFFENFNCPFFDRETKQKIENLLQNKDYQAINNLVYQLYKLDEEMIEFIEIQ
ncbi:hypothetical protein FACS189415_1070 [Bacteroidia bacterium]|nr:hypothetical protein FACS189415_1070 [Bacteroidia bacterium]